MNIPSLEELLKSGVHFGHKTAKRYPKAEKYIHTQRGGVHVIDLQKTVQSLEKTLPFIEKITKSGGNILFIGSKKQAKSIVKDAADSCGMPYIIGRWLGGTFTNFSNIVKLTQKLEKLDKEEEKKDPEDSSKIQTNFQKLTGLKNMVLSKTSL